MAPAHLTVSVIMSHFHHITGHVFVEKREFWPEAIICTDIAAESVKWFLVRDSLAFLKSRSVRKHARRLRKLDQKVPNRFSYRYSFFPETKFDRSG